MNKSIFPYLSEKCVVSQPDSVLVGSAFQKIYGNFFDCIAENTENVFKTVLIPMRHKNMRHKAFRCPRRIEPCYSVFFCLTENYYPLQPRFSVDAIFRRALPRKSASVKLTVYFTDKSLIAVNNLCTEMLLPQLRLSCFAYARITCKITPSPLKSTQEACIRNAP